MKRTVFALAALFTLVSGPVLAHTGIGSVSGIPAGLAHPFGGLDHVLAMIAVGILAARLGGRSVWLVPATFVGMMIAAAFIGGLGIAFPFVEQGIAGSVIILGLVIAVGGKMPMVLAMAMVGVLAVFHGYTHGAEIPATASGLEYGLGFTAATALLHAIGIGLNAGVQKLGDKLAMIAVRAGGGAIAAAGMVLLVT